MDAVLDTPELLELILSKLPVKDLLLVQNVCKAFNTAIASSPTLQQALFLRPLPATATPPSSSTSTKLFHYPGPEASWRRMLLTQPPVAELQVMLQTCNRGGTSMAYATICPGNGLRMGLL